MADTLLTENRKARFHYAIGETYEAGIVLRGTEVKSCRAGKIQLGDAYAAFRGTELYLQNSHIGEYTHGNRQNHDPKRTRKLLLHRRELQKMLVEFQTGVSIIPLKMYIKGSHIKVLLGMAKGKKSFDKRQSIKKREAQRDIERKFRR